MEWLSQILGMGGTAPFGSLASSLGIPTGAPGAAGSNVAGPPAPDQAPNQLPGGIQLPGIWGKMLGQQAPGAQPAAGNTGSNAAMNQAMSLLKPAQITQPAWMKLLSGPGGGAM